MISFNLIIPKVVQRFIITREVSTTSSWQQRWPS